MYHRQIILNKRLVKAVARNDINDCRRLIKLGADVNSDFAVEKLIKDKLIDENAIAILTKSIVSVQELVLRKIPLPGPFGEVHLNDLERAAIKNKFSLEKKLFVLPVLMNKIILRNESHLSPLQLATLYGWKEAMIELVEAGANPNEVLDIQGLTILHLLCTAAVFRSVECFIFDDGLVQFLFDHGADPNIQDVIGMTPLFCLSKRSDFHLSEQLENMKKSRGISGPDHDVMKGIEKYLICGGNPNIKDKYQSCTVLYDVVAHDRYLDAQPNLTNILLDHGSLYGTPEDILKNPDIRSMMQEEYGRNYDPKKEIDEFYSQHKQHIENNACLIKAIKDKDKLNINKFLSKVKSPNIRDEEGLSAMHHAVKSGEIEIINALFDKGADPNIKSWKNGTTPLFNAVIEGRVDIAELLLKHKANPNILNVKRLSPLYFSVINSNDKMTNLLLRYNGNPDVSNQISHLFDILNTMTGDRVATVVDGIFAKIIRVSKFLKVNEISIDFSLFYESLDIAENGHKKIIAKKIVELLDELTVKHWQQG